MANIKNVESQEKFHHFFIVLAVALLGAAVYTADFESLGKYGIVLELAGWLLLLLALVVALVNAWDVQNLFFRAGEAERARAILDQKDVPPDELLNAVERMDRLNTIFAELEGKFNRRVKTQLTSFALGILCIAAARAIDGIIRLKAFWWPG
jgi:hypothetical protein